MFATYLKKKSLYVFRLQRFDGQVFFIIMFQLEEFEF